MSILLVINEYYPPSLFWTCSTAGHCPRGIFVLVKMVTSSR